MAIFLSYTLSTAGEAIVGSGLSASGGASLNVLAGRLSIEANLSVSTSCWFGFDLEVGGALSVTGLTTIGSKLSIFGAVDVSTGQELEKFFL